MFMIGMPAIHIQRNIINSSDAYTAAMISADIFTVNVSILGAEKTGVKSKVSAGMGKLEYGGLPFCLSAFCSFACESNIFPASFAAKLPQT